MVRALLSSLPLLGFLGTVIGLTAAIGGLPRHLGPAAEGNLDISASLVGLAVKFETTLLGLAGGLLASLLLALLERREGELAAECRHLIRSLTAEAKVG
jgi:biopolymer transport protein ExbB/TolQ